MSMKMVTVDGFSYEISVSTVIATVTLTGTPSSKCKAGGKGICKHNFSATVSAITNPPSTIPDPGPYTFNFSATAEKCKADGSFVLRVDDETNSITANPQTPGSPPVTVPVSFKLKITDAGQSKVRCQ